MNNKSRLFNILENIDIINEYSMEGDIEDIIYLCIRKASYMVSHYCLLVKIKNLGIFFFK